MSPQTEQVFSGQVKTVSYVANESSTYPVKITVNEQSDRIRPGMPAEVTFSYKDEGERSKQVLLHRAGAEV